jgi:hypothetical protein
MMSLLIFLLDGAGLHNSQKCDVVGFYIYLVGYLRLVLIRITAIIRL